MARHGLVLVLILVCGVGAAWVWAARRRKRASRVRQRGHVAALSQKSLTVPTCMTGRAMLCGKCDGRVLVPVRMRLEAAVRWRRKETR